MGNSKGYGFVHFETQDTADNAISKVNGMLLNDKKVYVSKWISRKERLEKLGMLRVDIKDRYKYRQMNIVGFCWYSGQAAQMFTNVYVKNFADDFHEDQMRVSLSRVY